MSYYLVKLAQVVSSKKVEDRRISWWAVHETALLNGAMFRTEPPRNPVLGVGVLRSTHIRAQVEALVGRTMPQHQEFTRALEHDRKKNTWMY